MSGRPMVQPKPASHVSQKAKKKRPARGNDIAIVRQVAEPEKRVRAKEPVTEYVNGEKARKRALAFADQGLKEKDGLLYCNGCRKAIAF